ncbi:DUF659 domain-containing protein [Heracleum sosnowskyi]|uniref:DUF659 domain-containing protein n=1 Tax=Heracleum sosnowskyi TaxID=360622 RepID=A0AAD8I3K9_9APIA|nr:DUF659 domain-containing protein [Heracleum sosnowskyi]
MAFGKKLTQQREEKQYVELQQTQNQTSSQDYIDVEEEVQPKENTTQEGHLQDNKQKPLLNEVTFLQTKKGKNAGGTKRWRYNYCSKKYSSSYTRINYLFFGPPVGVKPEVTRCTVMLANRALLQQLRKKVEEAEKTCISPSLTRSTVNNKLPPTSSPIEKAFRVWERHEVDMAVERFLCANGIPFNVLRSPETVVMTTEMKIAPKDYKHLSVDRARTSLLDDCKRDVEKECAPVSDTWLTQGISIVSDGGTNIKKKPLINVIASNSRGSMFLYAEDFFGVVKTGKEIANFLLKSIDAVTMSPTSWWSTYGAKAPQLSEISLKVLSQPISSSSAERVWSTYSYIHNVKRNRLNSLRADKLVFIHSNIRLISCSTSGYKDGPYRKWDVNLETLYLDDSGARLEDLRWKEDGDGLDKEDMVPASKRQRYEDF